MFRSIQSRITAAFVAMIAATVVALGLGLSTLFGQVLHDQYLLTYKNNAKAINGILKDVYFLYGRTIPVPAMRKIVDELGFQFSVRIRMYVNGYSVSVPLADYVPKSTIPADHLRLDAFPGVSFPYPESGLGALIVSGPLTNRAYVAQQFEQSILWIIAASCLLAVFIGSVLSERLTEPFRVLTSATTRMGEGHLNERVPEGRRDEAGELARHFNSMAERLEASFETMSADRDRLRQFVADVSHELRTPLTALRTFNDLLQDGAGDDANTRHDFLAESARQIERLDWLTHNLLDLSRLDSGITQLSLQRADVSEAVRHALETNRPAAASKGITLTLDAQPFYVAHDPPRFEQAVNNVISNAVKFSPRGGTVRARVYHDLAARTAVVEVSDEGPGIPPDEVEHIFSRFYRGGDANRAGEGSGLGLAITKAIQDAHNGAITVDSKSGHGTTMRLMLPLANAHGASVRDDAGAASAP